MSIFIRSIFTESFENSLIGEIRINRITGKRLYDLVKLDTNHQTAPYWILILLLK